MELLPTFSCKNMWAVGFSATFVTLCWIRWLYIPLHCSLKSLMIQTDTRKIMLVHFGFVTAKNVVLVGEKSVTFFEECTYNGIIDRKEIVETFNDKW